MRRLQFALGNGDERSSTMLLGYGDLSWHIVVAAQGESPADQRLFQRVVQSKRLTDES